MACEPILQQLRTLRLWRRLRSDAPMDSLDQSSFATAASQPLLPVGRLLRRAAWLVGTLDPGLLLVLSGAALLAAMTLLPAAQQTVEAERARDQALAARQAWMERLAALSEQLDLLTSADRDAALALVMEQLRLAPVGTRPLRAAAVWEAPAASRAEEVAVAAAPRSPGPLETPSLLAQLARHERSRLVVMALALACVFAGLLPPATAGGGKGPDTERRTAPLRRWAARAWGTRRRGRSTAAVRRVDLTGARRRRALAILRSAP
ncbi:MAG: hypothetical protein D6824_06995 [Planctomycetota bacterium]|nr:MAG: hypothetical protein D6824_06995 [Planctomycetota bacterium]